MWISEQILYQLAKWARNSETAHSSEMKDALQSEADYASYRLTRTQEITTAAGRYGVPLAGRVVMDLGCSDGSISTGFLEAGASEVLGVDIDKEAIAKAQREFRQPGVTFHLSEVNRIPLPDESTDLIVAYDVFEHVAEPAALLKECHRLLRPGGQMLIGTWGWYHPFAPHLWSTMPVPWAHVFFSERTLLRTCRRVYHSDWYSPNMHDFDESGERIVDRYTNESIDPNYLNKFLVRDFERTFEDSSMDWSLHLQPFSSPLASWTRLFLRIPFLREFVTAYFWAVLTRPETEARADRLPGESANCCFATAH